MADSWQRYRVQLWPHSCGSIPRCLMVRANGVLVFAPMEFHVKRRGLILEVFHVKRGSLLACGGRIS